MKTGLKGRVAAVTGAASGIGLATARALEAEGCLIVASDINEGVVTSITAENPDVWWPVIADVAGEKGAAAVVDAALTRFGRIEIMVTCAGIYETGALAEVGPEEWDRVHAVNLRGTYLCARSAIRAMGSQGWGRIITFSSMAAQTGGLQAGPAYVAAKAGVIGLTRSLANSAGPQGITVNCLCPGIIETPMTTVLDEESKRATAARAPLRRNGTPEDVAALVTMLASDAAGFVTGAHLDVNGGLAMT